MTTLKFDWNPLTGIDIVGNFKIHFYSLMWLAAFVTGWYLMKRIFTKEKVNLEYLDPLFIYTVLATMLGARLGHVLFYQAELISEDFFSIFLPFSFKDGFRFTGFQGLASHGATIGIIIGMYLYRKKYHYKSFMWLLDRIAIVAGIGCAAIRFGNFINSEIIGKETASNFGVRFIQNYYGGPRQLRDITQLTGIKDVQKAYYAVTDNPKFAHLLEAVPYRHPSQLYEALCYLVLFAIIWITYNKTNLKDKPGFFFGLFFALLWTIRFFIEFLKEPQGDEYINWFGLNTGQWLSIPLMLVGLFFMFKKVSTSK